MTDARRVALITGGSRGIGLGIAQALAREGWDLAINGVRELIDGEEPMVGLRKLGADVLYVRGDVAEAADREGMVRAVRERFGRLHLLVNNAGVSSRDRGVDLLEAREENFAWLLRVNLQGPYFLTQLAAKWMIEQRAAAADFAGCIVNVTSVSAEMVSTQRGDYCLSKAALSMATRVWATRLAEERIPVFEVRPGIIRTDMTAGAQEKYDRLIADGKLLEPRWGMPEDIGRAVAMLARGDLTYAPGQVLTVDGGLSQLRL